MADIAVGQPSDVGGLSTAEAVARIVGRIERLPITGLQVRARVIVGTATFFDAFDAMAIAYVMPVLIPLWKLNPMETGILISIGFVGQLIGAVLFGWVAEKWGRKVSVLWSIAFFSVFSLTSAFAPSYSWLFAFRFVQGLGVGGQVPVAAAYISEISKAEGRGFFVLIYEAAFGLGLFLVSALGRLIVPSVGWQGMFIIGAIPAIVVVVMRFFVPESPRWLAEHGRYAEADRIVAGMEKDASKGGTVQLAPVVVKPHIVAKAAGFGSLFEGIYAKRTLTLWVIWSCTYFACYGMLTWLPTLYTTVYKLPLETALTYPVITGGFNFLATILPPFYVDRIGRKPILQFGMLIGAVEMLALWLSGAHDASLLLIFSSLGMFTFGQVALTVFVFSPENYPTRMRALGSSTASAWMRLASILSPTIMGAVVPVAGVAGAFLIIGLVLLAGGIVTSFAAIETKGKVLEELSP